ncbi:MAG: hypothetical protein LBP23_07610 [Treponema sp.]|jgi:hypothetical protein|nr:hypothetical protein [Treponema sp.]
MNSIWKTGMLLAGSLIFSACAGDLPKIIIPPDQTETAGLQREHEGAILSHQNTGRGSEVPEWVSRFLDRGSRGVEELEGYEDAYVFVGVSRGVNFKALGHWAEGFSAAQDFPRLAALRIEARLIKAASLYPDDEYGEFFEALVKKASDAEYAGAVKEASFWLLRRYQQDDEDAPVREGYEFFVLMRIEKGEFQAQVEALMADTNTDKPPTREQAAAINRIKETFFDDF